MRVWARVRSAGPRPRDRAGGAGCLPEAILLWSLATHRSSLSPACQLSSVLMLDSCSPWSAIRMPPPPTWAPARDRQCPVAFPLDSVRTSVSRARTAHLRRDAITRTGRSRRPRDCTAESSPSAPHLPLSPTTSSRASKLIARDPGPRQIAQSRRDERGTRSGHAHPGRDLQARAVVAGPLLPSTCAPLCAGLA